MAATLDPLVSDVPLIVYVDIKSPYAYLATFPTMDLEDRLGMEFDWRPLTLDIPSFLGSAKLDAAGRVAEQNRSEEQWRSIKYSYADCRRYASLRGRTLKGTVKIWDTSWVHMGFMWAKRQGHEVLRRFIQKVYEPFWRREFDAEELTSIEGALLAAGATTSGFRGFCEGEGRQEHDRMQQDIFAAGVFGIPGYVIDGEVLFGRENLPRIEWLLQGNGEIGVPDISYRSFQAEPLMHESHDAQDHEIVHILDFSQPESYLAQRSVRELADQKGVTFSYRPYSCRGPMLVEGGERTAQHLALRADHRARQLELGAASQGVDTSRRTGDCETAHAALAWLNEVSPSHVPAFVDLAFRAFWEEGRDLDNESVVADLMRQAGVEVATFPVAEQTLQLEAIREELTKDGVIDAPGFLVDGEFFLGRAHLPMILWRLGGEQGTPPL